MESHLCSSVAMFHYVRGGKIKPLNPLFLSYAAHHLNKIPLYFPCSICFPPPAISKFPLFLLSFPPPSLPPTLQQNVQTLSHFTEQLYPGEDCSSASSRIIQATLAASVLTNPTNSGSHTESPDYLIANILNLSTIHCKYEGFLGRGLILV